MTEGGDRYAIRKSIDSLGYWPPGPFSGGADFYAAFKVLDAKFGEDVMKQLYLGVDRWASDPDRLRDGVRGNLMRILESITPEKLLSPHQFIFEPALLAKIREGFQDKKVAVVDLDGVLRGSNYREADSPLQLNPEAGEGLQYLKSKGYTLVLWTHGSNYDDRVWDYLQAEHFDEFFELIISSENYVFDRTGEDQTRDPKHKISSGAEGNFEAAVNSATWLDEESRSGLLKEGRQPSTCNFKTPQLLFPQGCLVIDDSLGLWYTCGLSKEDKKKWPLCLPNDYSYLVSKIAGSEDQLFFCRRFLEQEGV